MVIATFPTLRGIGYPAEKEIVTQSLINRTVSGKRTVLGEWTYPLYRITLPLNYMLSDPASPTLDWQTFTGFFKKLGGPATPFHWNDPDDNSATNQALGTGNGTTTQFAFVRTLGGYTEPTLDVTTSSVLLYKTDWQGQQLQYSTARTNLALYSNDLTNAAWSKSNATVAKDQTGPEGTANSASSFTATAATASVSQTVTAANAAYVFGIWLKRITGSGAVKISIDGGATFTTVALTTSWQKFSVNKTTTNPQIEIQLNANGDKIAMAYAQLETGSTPTSSILTTSAAATVTDFSFVSESNWGFVYAVNFSSAPSASATISATFGYTWPCEFENDNMAMENMAKYFWSARKVQFITKKVI